MSDSQEVLAARLVAALQSAAMYNDKGFTWRNDTPDQIRERRRQFQQTLGSLADAIGPDALGPDLAAAVASGEAACDDSGVFVDLARQRFGTAGSA